MGVVVGRVGGLDGEGVLGALFPCVMGERSSRVKKQVGPTESVNAKSTL